MFCNDRAECQLALESNHRIANHTAMLASYISLRRREFANLPDARVNQDMLRLMDGIAAQVAAMSELHRMLTNNDSISSGDISAQLDRLCNAFRKGPACGTTIEYFGAAGCTLPIGHILPVSQIVSEVVTNALKYGHKAGGAGSIHVRCLSESYNRITISVNDEGEGISPGTVTAKEKGIGSRLVATLVEQVDGMMEYRSSGSGLSFNLSLPSADPGKSAHQAAKGQYEGANA